MKLFLPITVFSGVTSPANQKLGLRMTTLHEEQLPLARKHSLDYIVDEDEEKKYSEDEKNDGSVNKLIFNVNLHYTVEL